MKEGALRGTRVQIVSVNDLSLPTLWGTALGSGSSSPGMAFLILQQAGIVDRTPFQSYQAQSGLPGWAQAQGQAESGRGLWEGPSMVPGRERTRLPKPLGSQCLKPCGREHCEETPPQWHQRRHTGGTSVRIVWVSGAESLVQDQTHTGPQASMGSELQFSWLLNQPAGLCSACKAIVWSPPGAGGRCLWTLATCRGASRT